MRRSLLALLIVLGGVALLWLAGSKIVSSTESDALAGDWPAGLGAASTVPQRYPSTMESDAARALRTFPFPQALRKEMSDFVKGEVERASGEVAPPPSATGAYFAAHVPELDALEAALASQPIVWERDLARSPAPMPDLRHIVDVQRLLLARALVLHEYAASWTTLHATWNINAALLRRPELISALVGLGFARTTNAVARSLPAPAPAWRVEMLAMDYPRALVTAMQAEAWSSATGIRDDSLVDEDTSEAMKPLARAGDFLLTPYRHHAATRWIHEERERAASLISLPNCIVVPPRGRMPEIARRLGRFRIELDLTTKLLARDFSERSACPDGKWLYDGATLRFSNEFASGEKVTEMPLHVTVRPDAPSAP